jgi:Meiotically up-regulated gene 113
MWCIYIIQIILSGGRRGPIKIGISQDPEQRLHDLQKSNPYTLVLFGFFQVGSFAAARTLEASVHAALAAFRLSGEWFSVSPDTARRTIAEKAADLGYVVTYVAVATGVAYAAVATGVAARVAATVVALAA